MRPGPRSDHRCPAHLRRWNGGRQTGPGLPATWCLLHAIHGNDVLGVLVLILEVIIGQADILLDIQRIVGIHILQRVVCLDQEDVDLVIGSGAVLLEQGLVQLILVVVVIVGVDGPLYGDAVIQRCGGLVVGDLLDAGVIVVEAGLEFIVPAPDVQDLALLCGCIGGGLCGRAAGFGRGRISGGGCGRASGASRRSLPARWLPLQWRSINSLPFS